MTKPVSYKHHRFPREIIAHAVWLYFRSPLSLRLVEEMLLKRGIVASYKTVRRWVMKFGRSYARCLRRKTPSLRDIWHLDEVVITIASSTGSGEQLIKTGMCLMRSSRRAATPRPPSVC